jgi:acyl-coenzyme A synthetase/AMP-(fatty) acid ligase
MGTVDGPCCSAYCSGHDRGRTQLIAWTRDRLTHFKCPAGLSFAASLARTASGKLQKQAIRASLSSVAVQ